MPTIQTTQSTDSELLSRFAQSRDEEAFEKLMKKHWGFVYSIARGSLNNDALAEDASQQTFIALSKRADKLSKNTSLGPWLYRTVNYEASNIRRREQRLQKRNHDYAMLPDDSSESKNHLSAKLHLALSNLSDKDREHILLRFYEGLTAEQIATRLKISPAAAQRRTHRALERLSAFARSEEQDPQSFQLSLPLLLAPGIAPPKEALSNVITSKAVVGGGLLLPAAGWIIATTLSVSAVREFTPTPEVPNASPTETTSSRTRKARTRSTPAPPESPDLAQFIELARSSPDDAFLWARENFPNSYRYRSFIDKSARFLAENEPPLAKAILATREDALEREAWISEILRAGAATDLPAAVNWLESLPDPQDHRACWGTTIQSHELESWIDQFKTALALATTRPIKSWLASKITRYHEERDETKILELALTLDGEVKDQVLGDYACIQLDRDHPKADELIHQLKGNIDFNEQQVAKRNPTRLLYASLPYLKANFSRRVYTASLIAEWYKLAPDEAQNWMTTNDPNDKLKIRALVNRKINR